MGSGLRYMFWMGAGSGARLGMERMGCRLTSREDSPQPWLIAEAQGR